MNPRWPRRGLYAITPDEADTGAPAGARGNRAARRRGLAAVPQQGRRATTCAQNRPRRCSRCAARWRAADRQRRLAPGRRPSAPTARTWAKTTAKSRAARAALGADAILGASCYDDLRLARQAACGRRQLHRFRRVLSFRHQAQCPPRDAAICCAMRAALGLPRVAIGGITPDNARPLVDAGADLIAVISGVFDAPDPAAGRRRAYLSCFEDLRDPRMNRPHRTNCSPAPRS